MLPSKIQWLEFYLFDTDCSALLLQNPTISNNVIIITIYITDKQEFTMYFYSTATVEYLYPWFTSVSAFNFIQLFFETFHCNTF